MLALASPFFLKMDNVIQNYPWGSTTSLHELLNTPNPGRKHQAEIWMGAHPNGCSKVNINNKQVLLSEFINSNPIAILGEGTQAKFGELPYLFKVLAAEKALSIQVHPTKAQAEIGFAKEEAKGIPRNSSIRNYKDPNHKPELVFALTAYQAMNGFRHIDDIVMLFSALNIAELTSFVKKLSDKQNEQELKIFFENILNLDIATKESAVNALLAYASLNQEDVLFSLILELAEQYPGDIGLFAPLMLNVLTLQPSEAMFLDASTPHAYIKGTALEVMANSDNVLRAGLTPKYIDITELVSNTRFVSKSKDSILLTPDRVDCSLHYSVPVPDFKFSVYAQAKEMSISVSGAEILFAIDEPFTVVHASGETMTITKGESVFIPAYTSHYIVSCCGRFARAYN